MAVVAQKRRLSKTEHYKVAIRIRREIYKWVNRNFGVKDDRVFESMGYSPKWYSDASKYHIYSWRGTVTETKHIKYKSYHKIQRMDNFVNDILRKEAA